jgi:hypothetical protein
MNMQDITSSLLKKFRLDTPVPGEIRKFITASKKEILFNALKAANAYTILYGFVLRVFLRARRMGMRLSVMQSAVILCITSVLAATVVIVGIYAIFNYKHQEPNTCPIKQEQTNNIKRNESPGRTEVNKSHNKEIMITKNRTGIQPFEADNVDAAISKKVSKCIADSMADMKGRDHVMFPATGGKSKSMNYLITGSVGQLGGVYTITARLVSIESAKVVSISSESANGVEGLAIACRKVALTLMKGIK